MRAFHGILDKGVEIFQIWNLIYSRSVPSMCYSSSGVSTMSGNSIIKVACLALAIFFIEPTFAAEDATMHQVYQAAEAGKFSEAQSMMDKVLRDHPNSAK